MRLIKYIGVLVLCPSFIFGLGLDDALMYSTSGIVAQKIKLSITAENIANVSTLKVEETGLPYQKQYVVLDAGPKGVEVKSIEKSTEPFGKYFDPSVPQSDEYGFWYFPNVNLPDEMAVLTFTESMFEANMSAMKTTKSLYQTTIDALK